MFQICAISRKKSLQIFTVTDDKVSLTREMVMSEPPLALVNFSLWCVKNVKITEYLCIIFQSMDGSFVCVATSSEYKMVNFETNLVQSLFPFDSSQLQPTITKISRVKPQY